MKRSLAALALAALWAAAAFPAEAPAPQRRDEAPRDMTLADLMDHMATTRGVVTDFREVKTLKLLDAPLETKGSVYFAPPDRLTRLTTEPAETRLVLDGGRMRFEDAAGASDVDLAQNPVARSFADNLIVLWRGDRQALEDVYTLDFHAEGARWELALTPRHAPLSQFVTSIRLHGDGAAMREMDILESDGDSTQTFFEKTEVDHHFSADEERAIFGPRAAK
jgi:hypothetical protein